METEKIEKKHTVTVKTLPGSLQEISGSIPFATLEAKRTEALRRIGQEVELPGFRKGKVPAKMLEEKIGTLAVIEEAANIVLEETVPEILIQEGIKIISMPKVTITKIALGNPLEYKISVPVLPDVKLPNYKKIAAKALSGKEEAIDVTEKEIEQTMKNVQKTVAEWKRRKNETPVTDEKTEAHDEHDGHDHSGHDHSHHVHTTHTDAADKKDIPEEILPPLTDDDVKMIGDYTDLADFTTKLKLSMKEDKEMKARDKRRAKVAEALIEATKTDVPEVMIEDELEVMSQRLKHDVDRMGMDFKTYLGHLKKTEEELRKDWHPDAKKRVILQLALQEIAKVEKLEAPKMELEQEVKRYMQSAEGADENRVRDRLSEILRNEEVFKLLENQK